MTVLKYIKITSRPFWTVQPNVRERHQCLYLVQTTLEKYDVELRKKLETASEKKMDAPVSARPLVLLMAHVNK